MPDEDDHAILDTELLGFYIRRERIAAGYEKAEDFAEAITQQTGLAMSRQTMYNIESGKQEPRLSQYLAIMRVLRPDKLLAVDDILQDTLTPRWHIPLNCEKEINSKAANTSDSHASREAFTHAFDSLLRLYGTKAELGKIQSNLTKTIADLPYNANFVLNHLDLAPSKNNESNEAQ
jgi:DNA-binding XRE family transcriptional regulator